MAKKDLNLEKTNNMKELHNNSTTETMLTANKKEREPSKSYTLKSFAENIKKISKFGWITENEENELHITLKNCISKYTQEQYGNH